MHDIFTILISTVVGVVSSIISLGLIFGITMPFVGVLVRYRANYTPKAGAVRLDDEPGLAGMSPSDASLSYFGMMKRVHRIEGWGGLYKGLMPSIFASLAIMVLFVPIGVLLASAFRVMPRGGGIHLPMYTGIRAWALSFAFSVLPVLLLVPAQIMINRAITTPHKLAAFDARTALRVLLSPAERAQPLRLYLAPGVAFAFLLEALIAPALGVLRDVAAPLPLGASLGGAFPVILLTTGLITPLEVMAARLTLQRRGPETPEPLAADAPPVYPEPVMEFRTEEAPYTSLLDCGRKVVAEEGWGVLTRAWWVTALGMILSLGTLAVVPPTRF